MKKYAHSIKVRSYELDSQGHVNYAVYLNYCEHSRVETLAQAGMSFDDFIKNGRFIVIAEANLKYIAPAFLGDELEITLEGIKAGKTNITLDAVYLGLGPTYEVTTYEAADMPVIMYLYDSTTGSVEKLYEPDGITPLAAVIEEGTTHGTTPQFTIPASAKKQAYILMKYIDITKKIFNRRDAIRELLKIAQKDDIVIITGKGSEKCIMGPKGKRIPWDDAETVRKIITKFKNS